LLQKLFQQTFIYGLATVLPRMLSFLLLPLYTLLLKTADFGSVTVLFSLFAVFNVVLAYGMETSFFRFFQEKERQAAVVSTALISLVGTTLLFLGSGLWTAPLIGNCSR